MNSAKLLFNPYTKLSEKVALTIGFLAIFPTSFLCSHTGGVFIDILKFSGGAQNLSMWKILSINAAIYLSLALFFLILGKIFSKSEPRIIDVFAYVFFALTPLFFVVLCFVPESSRVLLSPPQENLIDWCSRHFTILAQVLVALSVVFFAWTLILLFYALKISANLHGIRLWISYFSGIALSCILMRLFVFNAICSYGAPGEPSGSVCCNLSSGVNVCGMYEGKLFFPGQTLRFRLFIDGEEKLKLSAASPDQSSASIPIREFTLEGAVLSFSIPNLDVMFKGGFTSEDGMRIEGTFSQFGYKIPLTLNKLKEFSYLAECQLDCEASKENIARLANLMENSAFISEIAVSLDKQALQMLAKHNLGIPIEDAIKQSVKLKIETKNAKSKLKISCAHKSVIIAKTLALYSALKIQDKLSVENAATDLKIEILPVRKISRDLREI